MNKNKILGMTIGIILVVVLLYYTIDNKTKLSLIGNQNELIRNQTEEIENLKNQLRVEKQKVENMEKELEGKEQEIERLNIELTGLYYAVSVEKWDLTNEEYELKNKSLPLGNPEKFNTINIDKDRVTINQIFAKPTPCTSVNYTIVKDINTINIVPKEIPDNSPGSVCVLSIAYDEVRIYLRLKSGVYILNLYEFWNKSAPFLSKNITIE